MFGCLLKPLSNLFDLLFFFSPGRVYLFQFFHYFQHSIFDLGYVPFCTVYFTHEGLIFSSRFCFLESRIPAFYHFRGLLNFRFFCLFLCFELFIVFIELRYGNLGILVRLFVLLQGFFQFCFFLINICYLYVNVLKLLKLLYIQLMVPPFLLFIINGPTWTRTRDQPVMSR